MGWRAMSALTPHMPEEGEPGLGQPFWMQRGLKGWSFGGWVFLREGVTKTPEGIAAASQLGGSQAGVRLAYGVAEEGRLRAYGRATMALRRMRQREIALGMAYSPITRWPVDIAIERRFAVGSEGRTAMAAMVTGGVSEVPLPGGFRLDGYGQAGVVGARRRDGFADGAIAADRPVGGGERASVRLGGFAAGAIQPGAARIDMGPRLAVQLPRLGHGSRIALDWRHRVAGHAAPASGLALTLATDF